ncbi:hypothetical protein F5Y17DRAFT_444260 [Xylariaceae sp. FL0594]|nr:hypothetical protein F5Y17DRAFT_444260 [Xylariaceae sp. FL0594]
MKTKLSTCSIVMASSLVLTLASPNTTPSPTTTTAGTEPCPIITSRALCPTCVSRIPSCLAITTLTRGCACPSPVPTLTEDYFCRGDGACPTFSCLFTSYVVSAAGGCGAAATSSVTA